mmetsp:Transcript_30053/g.62809  ORF Transcript_30053/g.62809 Transcript_30053/m.62809 type:complete len:170 (-) Transcript_30053:535-1044(-)
MEITEEQRERMRRNRQKALELQKRKREEREAAAAANAVTSNPSTQGEEEERIDATQRKRPKPDTAKKKEKEEDLELEEFEVGASEYVTKKDAMKLYLLPEGTLAVCEFVERENPRHKGWKPMKLYYRAEIRRRSRERFGSLQGLIEARIQRQDAQFARDLEKTKDIFKS